MIFILIIALFIWSLILQENMALDRETQVLKENLEEFNESLKIKNHDKQ